MNKDNKRDLILERSLTNAVEKTINQFDKDNFVYSGYQDTYGGNALKEYMLGMNFGYDSVGYQTTA